MSSAAQRRTTRPGAPALDRELVVHTRRAAAEGIVRLDLRDPDDCPLPQWAPGAHIDLILDGRLVRQYSLCGDPRDSRSWQVAVLREPESRGGSRYVHDNLHPGSRVRVRGPRNNFPLVEAERYLFIAGGIGITPIRPMLTAARATDVQWTLLYGGRTRTSMAFLDELDAEFGSHDGRGEVHIRPQDETGLLDLEFYLGTLQVGTAVYCCGPEPLLAAVEGACAEWSPGSLHVERFRADIEPPGTGADTSFEVELHQSGRILTVANDRTILQTLDEAGIDVLSSCEEGTCGTCMVPILEGTPDHRDSVLTDAERRAGDQILPCVSRSHSPLLVLDL